MDYQNYIDELVEDLRPRERILSPEQRILLSIPLYLLVTSGIMYLIAPFREGFINDLFSPHFLLESGSYILIFSIVIYLSYLSVVPGALKRKQYILFPIILFFIFALSFLSIESPALTPSMHGKRSTCVLEVLFLGLIPLTHLLFLLRKGVFYFKNKIIFFIAAACALIPGSLMQIACMYDPVHNLKFHFFPILIVGGIAWVLGFLGFSLFKKT